MSTDWHVEPATCHNCGPHQWHSLPCTDCTCETSTEAQTLIVPRITMPRMWAGDQA